MRFASEAEIDQFRAEFESGALPKVRWTHQAHLAAAAILIWSDSEDALPRVRAGILVLNERHGTVNTPTSGYHESLTVFWVRIVAAHCAAYRHQTRLQAINALMADMPSDLFKRYYSFDLVNSPEARAAWIEPDLQPLPAN